MIMLHEFNKTYLSVVRALQFIVTIHLNDLILRGRNGKDWEVNNLANYRHLGKLTPLSLSFLSRIQLAKVAELNLKLNLGYRLCCMKGKIKSPRYSF